jgi:sphingomyelin phosphodiesterase
VWNQSRADQLYSINTINNLLATTFPNKVLYSAVGNHEAGISFVSFYPLFHAICLLSIAPCNLFPTPIIRSDNISWLYHTLADSWINTLSLPNDTRESILRGGFYTTLVRPGLRLISLNTNYYASDNYWLFINSTDPLNQLEWVSY